MRACSPSCSIVLSLGSVVCFVKQEKKWLRSYESETELVGDAMLDGFIVHDSVDVLPHVSEISRVKAPQSTVCVHVSLCRFPSSNWPLLHCKSPGI